MIDFLVHPKTCQIHSTNVWPTRGFRGWVALGCWTPPPHRMYQLSVWPGQMPDRKLSFQGLWVSGFFWLGGFGPREIYVSRIIKWMYKKIIQGCWKPQIVKDDENIEMLVFFDVLKLMCHMPTPGLTPKPTHFLENSWTIWFDESEDDDQVVGLENYREAFTELGLPWVRLRASRNLHGHCGIHPLIQKNIDPSTSKIRALRSFPQGRPLNDLL